MRRRAVNVISAIPGGRAALGKYRVLRNKLSGNTVIPHRGYVGGLWDEIGKVQIDFLIEQGLKPNDVFLDVACGSLRAGRLFIEYLDADNYLGLDHNRWLIDAGLEHEVSEAVRDEKRPKFVVSESFEFDKFSKQPRYALAQSLFSHLTQRDIDTCLRNLFRVMTPGGTFFATFVPMKFVPAGYENPHESADDKAFSYEAEEILEIARSSGWEGRYIGDWGHPRGQEMLAFVKP